jgi:hypothetical protein
MLYKKRQQINLGALFIALMDRRRQRKVLEETDRVGWYIDILTPNMRRVWDLPGTPKTLGLHFHSDSFSRVGIDLQERYQCFYQCSAVDEDRLGLYHTLLSDLAIVLAKQARYKQILTLYPTYMNMEEGTYDD